MLILVSAILFAIGISLLALSAALLALRIVLWIVVVVFLTLYLLTKWMLRDKSPEPVLVEPTAQVSGHMEAFTLKQNKDGTWVLRY
jgi:hypothetical protein